MKILALIFGWCILLHGSDFAAMQGRIVTALEIPGSWLIPHVPWISLAIYIAAIMIIRRDKKAWRKWVSFTAVTVFCNIIIGYPIWLYHRHVHRISLPSEPSQKLRSSFESHFHVKTKWYGNSSEGNVLAVSVTDFSEDMESYIKEATQDTTPQP